MRVLHVNWVDYLDRSRRGGGVGVYQRNLLAALAERPGVEAGFLATGIAHSLRGGAPRVVPLPAQPGQPAPRWQLLNSAVLAPAHADFGNPAQISHPPTEAAFADFVEATGPWDAIHFNNIEGLPAQVLALRARWPCTRIVLSLHNYYPFCPQVNFWRQERADCTDFAAGAACVDCLPARPNRTAIRAAYAVEWHLAHLGIGHGSAVYHRMIWPMLLAAWNLRKRLARPAPPSAPPPSADQAAAFARRRAAMVGLINAHADAVLCVSDRVRQIALAHGIDAGLARTSYIGTPQAEAWARTAPRPAFLAADGTLRLAYLGYMRADKGFPFLMAALAALPDGMARRVHLTVAARSGAPADMAALGALAPRLASLTHRPGYDHGELDALLDGVDLGLVPVLWEDNLPQVAIEMHARHIPLLCSDRGGAQELQGCTQLVFRAGDAADFARALGGVLDGRVTPADAFRAARAPLTPAAHLDELLAIYGG